MLTSISRTGSDMGIPPIARSTTTSPLSWIELPQADFAQDVYEKRFVLCGSEELNGFELWRSLEQYCGGSGKEVDVTGLTKFMCVPQCKSEGGLFKHTGQLGRVLDKVCVRAQTDAIYIADHGIQHLAE